MSAWVTALLHVEKHLCSHLHGGVPRRCAYCSGLHPPFLISRTSFMSLPYVWRASNACTFCHLIWSTFCSHSRLARVYRHSHNECTNTNLYVNARHTCHWMSVCALSLCWSMSNLKNIPTPTRIVRMARIWKMCFWCVRMFSWCAWKLGTYNFCHTYCCFNGNDGDEQRRRTSSHPEKEKRVMHEICECQTCVMNTIFILTRPACL